MCVCLFKLHYYYVLDYIFVFVDTLVHYCFLLLILWFIILKSAVKSLFYLATLHGHSHAKVTLSGCICV